MLSANISFSVEATKLDATQELEAAGRCLLLLRALPTPIPVSLPRPQSSVSDERLVLIAFNAFYSS